MKRILVVNTGSTSTKIAVFEDEQETFRTTIQHPADELLQNSGIEAQILYRKKCIVDLLNTQNISLNSFDAVCGRGGMLKHIPSGTYPVNDAVITDIRNNPNPQDAALLGAYLAKVLSEVSDIPAFFVDPVSTDEMESIARISGFKGIERQSYFHALNHKATARKAAKQLGQKYEDLNLVIAHLGGGVSVAAHHHGRVIDVNCVKDDGAMGMDRGGGLPVNAVIELCYAGKSKSEVKSLLGAESGVFSYTGTKDFREVEERAFSGDADAMLVFHAFAYQLAKDIGAMSAVLHYDIDAIVLTGGIVYSERLCKELELYISKIAKVLRLPGEEEMRSLAEGALRVLYHEQEASIYPSSSL